MKRTHASLIACSSVLLSACLSLSPAAPKLEPIVGEDARIAVWLDQVRADGRARQSLRAVGKLRIATQETSGRVKQVVLVERPARLRLESLSLLGNTLSLLVTDGERFSFFDGRVLEDGVVSPDVLYQRMGLPLAPEEVVELLLGTPPLSAAKPTAVYGHAAVREVWLDAQRVRFGPSGELQRLEAIAPDGALRWRADYAQWRDVPGGRYPFEVALWFPETDLHASLAFTRVELNPELPSALFRVARRSGS